MSGRVGGFVYVRTAQGTVVRGAPPPRRATSAKEILATEQTAWVAGLWQRLSPEAMRRWTAYAAEIAGGDPDAPPAGTNGYLQFSKLGKRIMQIDPALPIPSEPPTGRFLGDLVVVTVSGSPSSHSGEKGPPREATQDRDDENPLASSPRWKGLGDGESGAMASLSSLDKDSASVRKSAEGEGTPTLPSPKGEEPMIESLSVVFAADRGNAPGVVTELLTQPLANGARRPKANGYRSRGFVAFEGPGSVEVSVDEGWHACATRFVERATGRCMGLLPCGVVRVAQGTA